MWDFTGLVLWAMYRLGWCPHPLTEDQKRSEVDVVY